MLCFTHHYNVLIFIILAALCPGANLHLVYLVATVYEPTGASRGACLDIEGMRMLKVNGKSSGNRVAK